MAVLQKNISSILLASPVILVLSAFIIVPIILITAVSFWGSTEFSIYPAFLFDNYEFLLTSDVTYRVFFRTLYFAVLVRAITLILGFTVAYYLAFFVHSLTLANHLFSPLHYPILDVKHHQND